MDSQAPRGRISPLLLLALALFVVFPGLASLYIDIRWFDSVGYGEILKTRLLTQVGLFAGASVCAGLVLYGSLRLARRLGRGRPPLYLYDPDGLPRLNLGALADRLIAPASLVVGLLAGLIQYPRWQTLLLGLHAVPFGEKDALFGRDVGFYVFSLPLWDAGSSFALFVLGASTAGCAAFYGARGALRVDEEGTRIDRGAKAHLSVLASLLLLCLALRAYLSTFDLLYSSVGPLAGASYADVHAKLPALRIQIAAAVAAAVLMLASARRESLTLPLAGIALYGSSLVGVWVYPGLVHRFSVQPNELEREAPFIKFNIDATRAAYGLTHVAERELSAKSVLTAADIAENADTIDNIRLWDHQPLLDAFAQIQEIRTYYDFASVDNDRYIIDGKLRQTMLSARELSTASLPNRTWINERFTFTHGYGIALGPVNEATAEGLPVLFVQDIPPVSRVPELQIKQPAIYFGERSNDYVFVRTRGREFDYPAADGNVETDYDGKDGIRFDSALVRAALTVMLGSFKILLSDDIDADSRVLLHRNIRARLERIAPFLHLDPDPYMVVRENGSLAWIFDAYTATHRYPYSEPSQYGINYIRNSVKAVIDAYDGTVELYVADDKDPIVRAWQSAFPSTFRPLSSMPSDLRAHLRYPELIFDLQTEMFSVFHMTSAELLYNREDQWEVPAVTTGEQKRAMRPYYTVMKLPGEQSSEFILMLPFTPKRKDNLAAWMVARSDGEHLGELVVYRFPKDRLVYGPQQVITRISQDAEISRQISLWDQRGSKAELGTLLVVPIEESLLYVRPLYLRSEGGKIPELKRVIVAYENRIAMDTSLRAALATVFGSAESAGARGAGPRDATAAGTPGDDAPPLEGAEAKHDASDAAARRLAPVDASGPKPRRALEHFERAIAAQRAGDWAAYGEELERVEALLRSMQSASPDASATQP